jgi:metal-responsive CopG/Arc/MetJ family transcriptional regulator
MNGAEFKNVTVQIEPEILTKIDERASELDLNRSQYLRRLIRRDLGKPVPELDERQAILPGVAA